MSSPDRSDPTATARPRTARAPGGGRAPDRRTLIADTAIATVATAGLRGLTHRAVDAAAGLPAGSTSYYFRTRTALIGACYHRLAELDTADYEDVGRDGALDGAGPGAPDRDAVAGMLAALLLHWLTTGRERQLARYELSLEAARNPELDAELHQAGAGARRQTADLLAALGSPRPREAAELLVAWADGLLYDRLAGATARSRPAPDPAELRAVARRMLDAALAD
ncbi:TetR/AcrR family transcriptional regulator [Streptomyces sp. NPDC093225]|uniref:TetR/AcrR family transcriptional regulator n=1 Tax=Streptomyces sp. NPDC093225 TaxID=3366034 RepID=UPI003818F731